MSPTVVIMAASVFLFFKGMGNKNGSILKVLSKMSFGIYLVHFMVRDGLKFFMDNGYLNEYVYLFCSPFVVLSISGIVIYTVSHIRILRFGVAGLTEKL